MAKSEARANKVCVQREPIMPNIPHTQKMQGRMEKEMRAMVENVERREGQMLHFMTPKQ